MAWLIFAASSALLVGAATQLAKYGDAIAMRTGLGRMFVGMLLLAGATSLPELLTAVNALDQGAPGLAVGSFVGSNMFNMLLLAMLDLLGRQARILRRVALKHALTASLAILLMGMVAFFLLADLQIRIGWVGVDSLLIIIAYVAGIRLIQGNSPMPDSQPLSEEELEGVPRLRTALIGFAGATAVLVVVSPWLVRSAKEIAEITGLGTSFVGAALLGVVTSLPEVATAIAAVRIGAYDLAVGNLFGSNAFNMLALALTDLFYVEGSFFEVIAPEFAMAVLLGLLLTSLGLIGNLARDPRRLIFVESDALLIMIGYGFGLWFLFARGIGA